MCFVLVAGVFIIAYVSLRSQNAERPGGVDRMTCDQSAASAFRVAENSPSFCRRAAKAPSLIVRSGKEIKVVVSILIVGEL